MYGTPDRMFQAPPTADDSPSACLLDELALLPEVGSPALQAIARRAQRHTGWQIGAIVLFGRPCPRSVVAAGVDPSALRLSDTFCERALAECGAVALAEAPTDLFTSARPPLRACFAVPLRVDDTTVGMLCVLHNEPRPTVEGDADALHDLATVAAALIQAQLSALRTQRQEARVRSASRPGSGWLWETDADGIVVWVSENVQAHTGEPPTTLVGRKAQAHYLPVSADQSGSFQAYLAAREAHEPFRDVIALRQTPLTQLTVSISADPVFAVDGRFMGYRGVTRDITDLFGAQQLAKSALLEQQRQLAGVLAAIPDLWFVLDHGGRYLECSHEAHPSLVGPFSSARGKRLDEVLPAPAAGKAHAALQALLGGGGLQRIEYELVVRGAVRQFEGRLAPLGDERVLYLERDLTELRTLEQNLRLMQRAFEAPGSLPVTIADATQAGLPLIFVNTAFETLTGRTRAEVLGRSCSFLQGTDRDQPDLPRLRSALAEGRGCIAQLQNYRADGSQFINELHVAPVHDALGRVTHFIGVQHDVTERRRAARQIEASEALYRSVTSAIADGLLVLDPQGHVVTANPAACALLGQPLEGLVGSSLRRPGLWLHQLGGTPAQQDEDPLSEVLRGGPDILGCIVGVRHADGTERVLSLSTHRLQAGADAEGVACVATLRDITEQRAAERRLAHAEARWRFALEEAGDGLLDYDDDQRRTFFSPRWKDMLGYTHQEIGHAPQEWSHRIHPQDYPQVMRAYRRYQAGEAPEYRSEHRLRHKNGHWVWVLDRAKIIERRPDGSVRRVIGVHTDITRLKAAERALRDKRAAELASTAKSEFLSRMSHEMRTPLNAVIGFAQLLQMRGEAGRPVPVAQYSEHILQSGRHLLALVNDVLDLQQVEAGRLSLALEPVDLAGALHAARQLIEPAASARGISIDLQVDPGLCVHADPRRLQQVLLNLMSNAVKYNRAGGLVHCRAAAAGASRAAVTIDDTGAGLAADELQRLFQPFERLGRETSEIEGSGLGLVISRALVQEMAGSLAMTSECGVGTRVRVELPLGEPPAPSPAAPPSAPARAGTSDLKMLYVEDNRLNALLFQEAIKLRGGIELRVVEDGPDALELLSDWHADILVLDAHLPTMSGYDVLSRLRELPRFANTPAFMCSADALPGELTRARDAGFAGYWSKPIDIAQVMRELDALPVPPAASAAFPQ